MSKEFCEKVVEVWNKYNLDSKKWIFNRSYSHSKQKASILAEFKDKCQQRLEGVKDIEDCYIYDEVLREADIYFITSFKEGSWIEKFLLKDYKIKKNTFQELKQYIPKDKIININKNRDYENVDYLI